MNDRPDTTPIPPDDPHRQLTVARPDQDGGLTHLGVVGDTCTDFEEMFTILEGELELTFRGEHMAARAEPPRKLDAAAQQAFIAKARGPGPEYRTELLPPPGPELTAERAYGLRCTVEEDLPRLGGRHPDYEWCGPLALSQVSVPAAEHLPLLPS
jgi:hypothetical protein